MNSSYLIRTTWHTRTHCFITIISSSCSNRLPPSSEGTENMCKQEITCRLHFRTAYLPCCTHCLLHINTHIYCVTAELLWCRAPCTVPKTYQISHSVASYKNTERMIFCESSHFKLYWLFVVYWALVVHYPKEKKKKEKKEGKKSADFLIYANKKWLVWITHRYCHTAHAPLWSTW